MSDIARIASYGSWLNFYLCQATVTGVRTAPVGGSLHAGVPDNAARCSS
jgi:phospholipid/cholesterol/gamma-HCH transport system substrate-binding protein